MKNAFTDKKSLKYIILCLLCTLCSIIICGCSSDPKNYSVSGLNITLTKAFEVSKANGFDIYIKSDDVIFTAVEETSSELELAGYEINSLDDYASEILSLNKSSKNVLKTRNNYRYFLTTKTVSGANYTYVHCIFNNLDSYWVCEFACKTKNYKKFESKILGWADTISFN